jgi:hypothetical protein
MSDDALDILFAPLEAADAGSGEKTAADRISELLYAVADAEGVALVADLQAAGYEASLIAAACTVTSADKRSKPRLAAELIAGHRMVWLTSGGWSAVGQTNRRGGSPASSQLVHRLAPANFQRRLTAKLVPAVHAYGVLVDTARGVDLRDYVNPLKGDAWGIVKGSSPEDAKDAGRVLEGVYPDAIVYENWPETLFAQRAKQWPSIGDPQARLSAHDGEAATFVAAVEIELSAKSDKALDRKMDRHDVAMRLGWWQVVVWITDSDDVLTRLTRAGLGRMTKANTPRRPGHYLLDARDAGIGNGISELIPPLGMKYPWWQMHLDRDKD